jgi:hypothetical protein
MPSTDLILWWFSFIVVVGLIPGFVVSYLRFPARTRYARMEEVINHMEHAVETLLASATAAQSRAAQINAATAVLAQSRNSMLQRFQDLYHWKNYILPLGFLTVVLGVGFFLIFSSAYPLYKLQELDQLLLNIPKPVFYGFAGGYFFALYSIVNRYRSSDIPPGLVLQLGYQVLFSGGVAYFASTLSPDLMEASVAFAAGFLPYGELTSWLRLQAQTRLGTSGASGVPASGEAPGGGGAVSAQKQPGLESLAELQGMSAANRERLGEESILRIQNLAFANPLALYLVTSYQMSQIIDWIDQAYLRMYVNGEVAARLTSIGIRGVIELAQAKAYCASLPSENAKDQFLQSLATALGVDKPGAEYFIYQMTGDPQVAFLELMWDEFGGT